MTHAYVRAVAKAFQRRKKNSLWSLTWDKWPSTEKKFMEGDLEEPCKISQQKAENVTPGMKNRKNSTPVQEEHDPALQLYGRSIPASSAASRIYWSSAEEQILS